MRSGTAAATRAASAARTSRVGARIFSVVDAFDAMTFDRPYSKAIPFDAAKAELKRCAGAHFDPAVVEAFLRVPEPLLEEIRRRSTEP